MLVLSCCQSVLLFLISSAAVSVETVDSEDDTEKEQRELSVFIMKLIFPRPSSRPVTRSALSELC